MVMKESPSYLTRLFRKLRERWVVGAEYDSYILPTKWNRDKLGKHQTDDTDGLSYRIPSPASEALHAVQHVPQETEYNIAYYKRREIEQTGFKQIKEGEVPDHIPRPWWADNKEGLKEWRRQYRMTGGLPMWGVYSAHKHYQQDSMQLIDKDVQKNLPFN